MISKILHFVEAPFNKRDYKRLGIEIFIKEGFEVHVWDFTPFLYPHIYKTVIPPDPVEFKNLNRFYNKSDSIAAIRKEDTSSFVINNLKYNVDSLSILRAISKKEIPYALTVPNVVKRTEEKRKKDHIIKRILRVNSKTLLNYALLKTSPALLNVKSATFLFSGGTNSPVEGTLVSSETEIIRLHTFDYDIFLEESKGDSGEGNYIVFLDSYLPFHPDNLISGMPPATSPEDYYPALCRFFNQLEKEFGLEVIIAAHPRSHYENHPDLFEGRKIERGKTSRLIRNAKFVALHGSAAINFAVLYKKPMIFITTDSIEKSPYGKRARYLASFFRKKLNNISKEVNLHLETESVVDEERYSKYKNDYIKTKGSEELPFWKVVCNKIRSLDA